jgi:hypothetical protein
VVNGNILVTTGKEIDEIPPVAASDNGRGQTRGFTPWGCRTAFKIPRFEPKHLERCPAAGDRPVGVEPETEQYPE